MLILLLCWYCYIENDVLILLQCWSCHCVNTMYYCVDTAVEVIPATVVILLLCRDCWQCHYVCESDDPTPPRCWCCEVYRCDPTARYHDCWAVAARDRAASGAGGGHVTSSSSRVFDEISFRENFAKLATIWFSCFAKMRDEVRSFAKLPRLRKKRIPWNTKIAKTKKTWSKNKKFNYFSWNSCEDARLSYLW